MAKYWTDFSEYTTGNQPADWSYQYESGATFEVQEDATAKGGKWLYCDNGPVRSGLSWDDPSADPDRVDSEVYMEFFFPSSVSGSQIRALIRGADATGTGDVDGYTGGASETEKFLHKYLPSSNQWASVAWSPSEATRYSLIYRVNGTSHRLKIWETTNGEPQSWDIDETDPNKTSAGVVGIMFFSNNGTFVDVFGVGTNGDAAPQTEPTGASAGTILEPAGALSTFGGRATVKSSILEAVASADSDGGGGTALSTLTAPALSDDTLNALSNAAVAIVAGASSDDAWTARATALAQLINQGAAAEDVYREATLLFEGLITEPSAAGSRFLNAARMLASLTAGATPTEALTALVTAVGTFTDTASAGATFTRATGKLLANLSEAAQAAGVFDAVATTKASVSFAAAAGAFFSGREAGRRYLVLGAVTLSAALELSIDLNPALEADAGMNPELGVGDIDLKPN